MRWRCCCRWALLCFLAVFETSYAWGRHQRFQASSNRKFCSSFALSLYGTGNTRHPSSLSLPVLFEDEQILVVDKPGGVSHHGDKDGNPGILSIIREQQAMGVFRETGRLFGVHRLDRVTSGILVFAKDPTTAKAISQSFRNQRVTKYYTGLSSHKPSKKQGLVIGNMVRGRRKSWYLTRDAAGDNVAKTRFYSAGLGQFITDSIEDVAPRTLLVFKPYTGKTHQLRVAAKSLGLPLLGDPVYADTNSPASKKSTSPPSQTYLHSTAWHLPASRDHPEWTIWSQPYFPAWNSAGSIQFERTFDEVMQKRCDCEPILKAYADSRISSRHENERNTAFLNRQ